MLKNVICADKETLVKEVMELKMQGFRLAAVSCETEGEKLELTYNFDLDYDMKHIRILVDRDDTINSISSVYPSAFLIENEFQDLYGFVFNGLTIDYKGRLYLSEKGPKTPLI